MTSRERCFRAIRFQRPDRPPVVPQAHVWTHTMTGVQANHAWRTVLSMQNFSSDLPAFDAPTNFAAAGLATKGKSFLPGNVDTPEDLTFGTPEHVVKEGKERLEIAGTGGGFILRSGCTRSPKTPAETIKAMVGAVKEYGVY
jgi:uroporphyrinogen-III decarboxylase